MDTTYDHDLQDSIDACNEVIDSLGRRDVVEAAYAAVPSIDGDYARQSLGRATAALAMRDLVDDEGAFTPEHYRIMG